MTPGLCGCVWKQEHLHPNLVEPAQGPRPTAAVMTSGREVIHGKGDWFLSEELGFGIPQWDNLIKDYYMTGGQISVTE